MELPPVPARYLVDWWLDIGPTAAGSGGEGPLGWQDLAAWERITGVELLAWEARVIRRMSRDSIAEGVRAKKPDCPPPWQAAEPEAQVNDRVTRQFAALKQAVLARDAARQEG